MKRTDVALIIFIAAFFALIAYFIGHAIFGGAANQAVNVKVATPISSQVAEPDSSIFNKGAINPTVEVIIGGTSQSGQ